MSEPNRPASERDLRVFGALLPLFFALLGGWLWWGGKTGGATTLWVVAAIAGGAFWAVRGLRRPLYGTWMWVFHPVGWLFSHLVMAIVYYLVLTPMGLIMRLLGRDPMQRAFRRDGSSHWRPRSAPAAAERYFRQF